jgi:NDP-hexose 2,3-enoyl reductase
MEYTNLGRTGLKVSRIALGTMNFGSYTSERESHAVMDRALDCGVNLLDTANVYGRKSGPGGTELILGRWFAHGGGRRDKVVLATKVYGKQSDAPNDRGLSARHIIRACDASLKRLQTDWIDLYQMHHVDRSTPWDEIWQALETIVVQGKVRYVGSCNFAGWHIATAQAAARERRLLGLVSEQCIYNLRTRHVELEVVPSAIAHGLGVLPWSPLHGGMLAGVLEKRRNGTMARSATGLARDGLATDAATVESYEHLCADIGQAPATVALAWLLSRPGVTAPIVGARSVAQLDESVDALGVTLSDDATAQLDKLFPPIGNGGPAPEAWAW